MIFAYFDAFFSDSIREICKLCPNVLCREKKISWLDVLEQGNWDNLLQRLVEDYVFETSFYKIILSEIHKVESSIEQDLVSISYNFSLLEYFNIYPLKSLQASHRTSEKVFLQKLHQSLKKL